MLTNETISKLHEMHLSAMAEAFASQMNDSQYNELSFEDRFSMVVDAECYLFSFTGADTTG